MGLIASLGLSEVSGDPNDLKTGKFDGVVSASEFVLVESKKQVSHVVTYKVTEGESIGAEKQVWYNLYTDIVDAEGNFPAKVEDIKNGKALMTEKNKQWYKKLFMDLTGCAEDEVDTKEPSDLLGIEVTFGVAEKNGYKNVNFVERRNSAPAEVATSTFGTNF